MLLLTAVSWVKKTRQGTKLQFSDRHCKFRTHSDSELQISDEGNYGCSKFQFCPKFSKNRGFQPQILHFWTKIFGPEFPTIFQQPKNLEGGSCHPCTPAEIIWQ